MPYDFDDLDHQDHLAPSEIRPPMNFADGGLVSNPLTNVMNTQSQMNMMSRPTGSFSGMSSQINTNPSPAVMTQKQTYQGLPQYQPKSYQPDGMPGSPPPSPATQSVQRTNPYDQGLQLSQKQPEDFPAQPFEIPGMGQAPMVNQQPQQPQPQVVQVEQQPQSPLAMAKGGAVGSGPERLIAQIRKKFAEQGIDFDKIMAMRLQHMGQKGDTMLAHINPEEAKMLKDNGGSGKINPHTGLPSFGFDDGPEAGGTGSFSAERSAEGRSVREGDTVSGASSGGGGGGAADTSGYDRSNDNRGDRSSRETDSGGGRDSSSRSSASDAITNELNRQRAEQAVSSGQDSSFLSRIGDALNQIVGITPAEAAMSAAAKAKQAETDAVLKAIAEAKLAGVTGSVPLGFKSPQTIAKEANLVENQAQAAIDAAGMRAGFPTGQPNLYTPTTGPTTTFNADSSGIVPTGSFVKEEKTIPEIIRDFINPTGQDLGYTAKYTLPDVGLRIGSQGTSAITTESKSPFQSVVDAITSEAVAPLAVNALPKAPLAASVTQPNMSNAVSMGPSPAQFRAAENKSMADLAAAQAQAQQSTKNLFDEYGVRSPVASNVPFPMPVPGRVPVEEAAHPIPPEDIPPAPPPLTRTGVPMPPIPYRDLGEGNILDSLLKPFGLDTESWINNKAAEYEKQGLTPSDAAIQASYDLRHIQQGSYGPYGNMTFQEYREAYGGGRDTPTTPQLTTPKETTPKKPNEKPKNKKPYRTYLGLGDLENYGLGGGERSFYDYAKGGAVSPLKAVKKNG